MDDNEVFAFMAIICGFTGLDMFAISSSDCDHWAGAVKLMMTQDIFQQLVES